MALFMVILSVCSCCMLLVSGAWKGYMHPCWIYSWRVSLWELGDRKRFVCRGADNWLPWISLGLNFTFWRCGRRKLALTEIKKKCLVCSILTHDFPLVGSRLFDFRKPKSWFFGADYKIVCTINQHRSGFNPKLVYILNLSLICVYKVPGCVCVEKRNF